MRALVIVSACLLIPLASAQKRSTRLQDSQDASAMLNAAKQAQDDLQKQDKDDALKAINHALDLASKLDKSGQKGRLVPIYGEAISVAVYTPSKVPGAGQTTNAETPSPQQGTAERSASLAHPTVEDVAGESTRTFVNTGEAKQNLENAKSALSAGDLEKAQNALDAVQHSETTETVVGDEPLARARANLILAGHQAGKYAFTDAATSLNAALKSLEEYSNAHGQHAADARVIGREIALYLQHMPQDPVQVAGRTQVWWDQIASWTATPNAPAKEQK